MAGRRRGFSLVEMLVVIGLLAILSAISLGAWAAMRTANPLIATRQVVADLVRQARHAARTGGAPVVLRIENDPDLQRTTVAGVSRVLSWSEDFEGPAWQDPARPLEVLGLTGRGYQPRLPEVVVPAPLLERHQRIRRGDRSDGFLIAIAVRIPTATGSPVGTILPLIAVGGPDPLRDETLCGLLLRKLPAHAYDDDPADDGAVEPLAQRERRRDGTVLEWRLHSWEVLGWVRDEAGTEVTVSSHRGSNRPKDQSRQAPVLRAADDREVDIAVPVTGEGWEDFALLWSGGELTLYRGGRRIAVQADHAPGLGDLPASADRIHVGELWITEPGGVTEHDANACVFDHARLERLGTDRMTTLPPGVTLRSGPDRIVCHPDGRVAGGDLAFSGGPGRGSVTVSVDTQGVVTSSLSP